MYVDEEQSIRNITVFLNIKNIGNRYWTDHKVGAILSNKVYIGKVYRADLNMEFELNHEHIVSVEQKEKALELLEHKTRNNKRKNKHL